MPSPALPSPNLPSPDLPSSDLPSPALPSPALSSPDLPSLDQPSYALPCPCHIPLLCLPVTRSQLHLRTSPTSGMGLVLGGRARVVLTGHADASWADDLTTQRSSQGYTFSLGSGFVSWRGHGCTGVTLAHLPADRPRRAASFSSKEHRLEHRTKHIALRYFLARELQQRGQLRLAYVGSRAKTADVFTKALQPCDHQRFCTIPGLVPTVPHLLTS
ncbi:unnamed protein product [Closterium sp. NIES-53]